MLTYASFSEPGGREINEDSIGCICEGTDFLFALADGLGGHGKGEVASALAVDTSLNTFEAAENRDETLLSQCMMASQEALLALQRETASRDEMKTTLVLLRVNHDEAQWAHIGDSRLYSFSNTKLTARTLDHSVPQMLVATGEIREQDIRFHEDRNRLIRVMGMEWDSPKYSLSDPCIPKAPMSFLLCSDGFWEYIDERAMARCLRRAGTPRAWLDSMRRIIEKNGRKHSMDNYSAIAVFIR